VTRLRITPSRRGTTILIVKPSLRFDYVANIMKLLLILYLFLLSLLYPTFGVNLEDFPKASPLCHLMHELKSIEIDKDKAKANGVGSGIGVDKDVKEEKEDDFTKVVQVSSHCGSPICSHYDNSFDGRSSSSSSSSSRKSFDYYYHYPSQKDADKEENIHTRKREREGGRVRHVVLSIGHNGLGNQLFQHTFASMFAYSINADLYIKGQTHPKESGKVKEGGGGGVFDLDSNTIAGAAAIQQLLPPHVIYPPLVIVIVVVVVVMWRSCVKRRR
jgi:hypothetical protein